MQKGDKLFVYGSLRVGEYADLSRSERLGLVKFDSQGRINGRIYGVSSYPGFKGVSGSFAAEEPSVVGDIFELTSEAIVPILDFYEGYPHHYDRIETETEAGETVWVYVYQPDVSDDELVASGDWTQRARRAA